MDDPVWLRVNAELTRRKSKHAAPADWYALGRRLGVDKQVIGNWKQRGVPKARHPEVADALGWSVDRLLGREDAPTNASRDAAAAAASPETSQRLRGADVAAFYERLPLTEQDRLVQLLELVAAGFPSLGNQTRDEIWDNKQSGASQEKRLKDQIKPINRRAGTKGKPQ